MRFLKKGLALVLAAFMMQSTVWTSVSAVNTEVSEVSASSSYVESSVNPVKILLDNNNLYLYEGENSQLTVTFSPSDATSTLTWTSSNTKVATVDNEGKIFAVAKGIATVTARTANGLTASCTVNVSSMPQEVFLDKTSLTMIVKDTYQLVPSVAPDDAYSTYSWLSSNTSVVKVSDDGLLTALKVGTATIAVTTSNGLSTLCTVKVIAKPTALSLNKTEITLRPEETLTLTKTVTPSNATADYVWKSNDTKVATVDQTGKVTGVALGSTEVSVTSDNGLTATCKVDVKKYPDSVALDCSTLDLVMGKQHTLKATLSPADSYAPLKWKTSSSTIATVDQTGKVTGKAIGECVITVSTDNGKSASCTVKVSSDPTSVTINEITKNTVLVLQIGKTYQFTAKVLPVNSVSDCTWESSDSSVVSVDENGLLTGKSFGIAVVTVRTVNDLIDSRVVYCGEEPTAVHMMIDDERIPDNAEVTLNAQASVMIVPELETAYAVSKLVWTYEKNGVISISVNKNTGVATIKGAKPGTCKVTVTTDNGKTAQCTIKVVAVVTGLEITNNPQPVKLNVGQKVTLSKKVTPSVAVSNYTWVSSNENVAAVNENGVVTAKSIGSTRVSVTAENGVTTSCEVQVCPLPEEVAIVPSSISLSLNEVPEEGQTVNPSSEVLALQFTPSNAYSSTLKWASDNTSVAVINSSTQKVTAKDTGTANITVTTSNGKTATCEVSVVAKPSAVRFEESASTFWTRVGETCTLTPVLTPAHAVTTFSWSSNNEEIATVDANGLITAHNAGTATITVTTDNDKKATFKLQVYEKPKKVYFDQSALSMYVTQEFTFVPHLSPENSKTKSYAWKSSDTSVATVDEKGTVVAKKIGNTVITATNDLKQVAKCIVTVYPVPEEVFLDKTSVNVNIYKTVTLTPSVTPDNAFTAYTWTSSDTSIATVDENGKVKGVAIGTATVTVSTSNNKTAVCKVNVKKAPTNVSFENTSVKLGEGQSYTLTPILTPSNAYTKYTWTSSDTSVATVNSQGKISAKGVGKATITVTTLNNKTATCTVTVARGPSVVSLDKTTLQLGVGRTYQLHSSLTPSNAVTYCNWSSDKKSVATVSGQGVVTAKSVGTAKITVKTSNGKNAECTVTVKAAPTAIALNKTTLDLGLGQTYTLQSTLTPTNAFVMNTWSSSNLNIVSVNSAGKISAKSVGTATITVKTYNGMSAQCVVTVKKAPTSVSINKTTMNIAVGQEMTLTSSLTPADAYTYCSWSSSDTSVAKVSGSGTVTGVKVGTADITVRTSNGKTAVCKVTVKKAPTAITLNKTSVTLNAGEKFTLTKTLTPTNAFSTYKWKSSNTIVATVSSSGEITAKSTGTATITVTAFNGVKATCKVTVK